MQGIQSTFPKPPDFYRRYSAGSTSNESTLTPPEPPKEPFVVFGEPFQTSLEPLPNPSIDLKKSVAELWDTYRALLRDLIADPTQAQKCERIRELLTLLHQQINYYRDVQAQESLDLIRRQQIQARRNLKDRIDELEERTRKEYREIASEIRKVL